MRSLFLEQNNNNHQFDRKEWNDGSVVVLKFRSEFQHPIFTEVTCFNIIMIKSLRNSSTNENIWIGKVVSFPKSQLTWVLTAGLATNWRVGPRWHFRCGSPISKPRPVLDFSSKNQGSFFYVFESQKMSSYGQKWCFGDFSKNSIVLQE